MGGFGPYGAPLAGAGEGGTTDTTYKAEVSGAGTGGFSYGSTNTGSNPTANVGDTSSTVASGWDQNMYSQYMQQYMQQYSAAYQVSHFYNAHE